MDTERLLQRIANGDQEALQTIVQFWESRLQHLLVRGGTDPETAEEIAQDTFHKLWHFADTIKPDQLKPWLFRVAQNGAIDRYRKKDRNRGAEPLEDRVILNWVYAPSVFEQVQWADYVRRLRPLLAQLPPAYREAVELRYLHELNYQEIAAVLHIPMGTVKSRMNYGLKRLRSLAAEQGWTTLKMA